MVLCAAGSVILACHRMEPSRLAPTCWILKTKATLAQEERGLAGRIFCHGYANRRRGEGGKSRRRGDHRQHWVRSAKKKKKKWEIIAGELGFASVDFETDASRGADVLFSSFGSWAIRSSSCSYPRNARPRHQAETAKDLDMHDHDGRDQRQGRDITLNSEIGVFGSRTIRGLRDQSELHDQRDRLGWRVHPHLHQQRSLSLSWMRSCFFHQTLFLFLE